VPADASAEEQCGKDFVRAILGKMFLLQSPQFLYRVEHTLGGRHALTNFELATRLAYLLTDSTPDGELLAAADAGMVKAKDLFPAFSPAVAGDLRLATERFVDHIFWDEGHDLGSLLTDSHAYVNDNLAPIYGGAFPGATLTWAQVDAKEALRDFDPSGAHGGARARAQRGACFAWRVRLRSTSMYGAAAPSGRHQYGTSGVDQ